MSDTYNITPTDFQVRMQSIACCLASKGYDIAKKLKVGIFCNEDIKRWNIAHAMFDLLKSYNTTKYGTLPYYLDEFITDEADLLSYINGYSTELILTLDGVEYTINTESLTTLNELILAIQEILGSGEFNIICDDVEDTTTWYLPEIFSGVEFTIEWVPAEGVSSPYGGTLTESTITSLDDNNCTTTDQVNQRFEWFQTYCDLCFNADYGAYEQNNLTPIE